MMEKKLLETKILLVRHGHVDGPIDDLGRELVYGPDVSLSELGKKQLTSLAKKIKRSKKKYDLIITSPYKRTKQSARILASILNLQKPTVIEDLHDSYVPGLYGIPIDQMRQDSANGIDIYKKYWADGQETYEDVYMRCTKIMNRIAVKYVGKKIIVVSHGDPISMIVWNLRNPNSSLPEYKKMIFDFYLNKGQGYEFITDEKGLLKKEVGLITVKEVAKSKEKF